MTTELLLPALAVAALTDRAAGDEGILVASRQGRTLHALLDTGRALTPTCRVRRTARPLCGRAPLGWRLRWIDGRPLCATCARALRAHYGPAALSTAATWVPTSHLAQTFLTARDKATVHAGITLLMESGHTGKSAVVSGHSVRLTQLAGDARTRLSKGPHLTDRDYGWFSTVKNAPARAFPRRVR